MKLLCAANGYCKRYQNTDAGEGEDRYYDTEKRCFKPIGDKQEIDKILKNPGKWLILHGQFLQEKSIRDMKYEPEKLKSIRCGNFIDCLFKSKSNETI